MENFISYNSTKLYFGKGVVNELGEIAAATGKKALLVCGGGSIKRNGSYDDTVEQLKANGISIVEYNGIKPNPLVSDVDDAAQLGLKEEVDFIVAIGGGSVIDSAKIITACISEKVNAWDIMTRKHDPKSALPLIIVLTLAATGTEMNSTSVLQNPETGSKRGFKHPLIAPKYSFLDPTYTQSVPLDYTVYGVVDLIAHCLEAWFGGGNAPLSDRFVISIIQEAFDQGPKLIKDLENFELRSRIMWAATCALNDTTMHGRVSGDWGVHVMGHTLSYLFDTAHGATLSIVYPSWMRYMEGRIPERIIELGSALFGVDTVEETASGFEKFFKEIGSPIKASEAGINEEMKEKILSNMNQNDASGMNHALSESDREAIVNMMII